MAIVGLLSVFGHLRFTASPTRLPIRRCDSGADHGTARTLLGNRGVIWFRGDPHSPHRLSSAAIGARSVSLFIYVNFCKGIELKPPWLVTPAF